VAYFFGPPCKLLVENRDVCNQDETFYDIRPLRAWSVYFDSIRTIAFFSRKHRHDFIHSADIFRCITLWIVWKGGPE